MKTAEQWAKQILFGDPEFTSFTPTDQYMVEFADLANKIAAIQQESTEQVNFQLLNMLKAVHEAFTVIGTRKAMEEALWGCEQLVTRAEEL
jgi:hypothetical protein